MTDINLFPLPLFHVRISDWVNVKPKIEKLISDNTFSKNGPENILTDFYSNKNIYNNSVEEIFKKELNQLYKRIGALNYKVKSSWIEVSKNGMHHDIHNHGMLGISSVCYVKYNHRVHTPTQFICPFNNFRNGLIIREEFKNIREGSLIFFPSFINHFTNPNTSDEERIILSFNVGDDNMP